MNGNRTLYMHTWSILLIILSSVLRMLCCRQLVWTLLWMWLSSHRWNLPGQFVIPWVQVQGKNVSQWVAQWRVLCNKLKESQTASKWEWTRTSSPASSYPISTCSEWSYDHHSQDRTSPTNVAAPEEVIRCGRTVSKIVHFDCIPRFEGLLIKYWQWLTFEHISSIQTAFDIVALASVCAVMLAHTTCFW